MKTFNASIKFLKLYTVIILLASIGALISGSFDPFYSLEGFLGEFSSTDSHEKFAFAMRLFALASIAIAIFQMAIIRHGLALKNKWAYKTLVLSTAVWGAGTTAISLTSGYLFYFYFSAIPATLLYIIPLVLIRKDFKVDS